MKVNYRRVVISFIFAPLLYVSSYLALVEARPLPFMIGIGPWPRVAKYRFGGATAEVVFWPLQRLDERLRPDYWQFQDP